MARTYQDRAKITIEYGTVSKQCFDIESIETEESNESKPVATMNPDGIALGYRHGTRLVTGKITAAARVGEPENDWRKLMREKTIFQIFLEGGSIGTAGSRQHIVDCVINRVSVPYNKDGETMESVDFLALDVKDE